MNEWKSPAQPVRCMVDLSAPLVVRYAKGVLVQGDENANAIVAEVYQREGVPFDLTGCTATLTFVRPDNMAAAPIAAEISGNVAVATLTDLCYTKSGTYVASLQLKMGGAERTIVRIVGEIASSENSGTVTEEQILPTPEELLATLLEVEEARNNANAAAEAASEAAERAGTAANSVNEATGRANAAAASIEGMTASANQLEPDANATATVTDVDGVKHITFGIPKGERGEKGEKGDPGTAENVTIDSIAGLRDELNAKQPKGDYATKEDLENLDIPVGGVVSVNTVLPDENGNITLTHENVGALSASGTAENASKLGGVDASDYVQKSQVVNNFTTTEEGFVADARALKELSDRIGSAGSETEEITTTVENASLYTKNTMGCRKLGKVVCVSGTVVVGSTAITNKAFRSGLPNTSNGVNTLGTDDDGNPTAIYLLNGSVFIRKAAAGEIVYFAFTYIADE